MKKIFTIIAATISTLSFAGTPTIDGVFNAGEGWGSPIGTGTQTGAFAGWSGSDAKMIYYTSDANFHYFAASVTAGGWMQFVFVVNTQTGGGTTDSWGRQITYNHTNRPDYLFRGDIGNTQYTEHHSWNGTAWTGVGTAVNASGTETKATNTGDERFIELRVPRATITGNPTIGDIQFIISGDNNTHGCFDAIPNDNNGTSWSAPGNATTVSQYVTNVPLPSVLSNFSGSFNNNAIALNWRTSTEINAASFDVEKLTGSWSKIGAVAAANSANGSNYGFVDGNVQSSNVYRLKMIDKDGTFAYSNAITVDAKAGDNNIAVFPTLVQNDVINIRLGNTKAGKVQIAIFNMEGKQATQRTFDVANAVSTVLQYPLGNLIAGNYVVKVIPADGSVSRSFTIAVQ